MSSPLQPHETERLRALEQTVREGLRDFRRTGQALSEIRDNDFFDLPTRPSRPTYKSAGTSRLRRRSG
ncbi:hypothetical protein ACFSC4_01115 [Deinococcus malanensis]|uniref:hypothetical protein n=1 Tax=Deinococcus malanensis TaxID=1706855 RepID=UPI0036429553